jgi:redox-sensitive bicupin YhaK (pirin superfamily)
MATAIRPVTRTLHGQETSDGAGVRLVRLVGSPRFDSLDPFLLLDAFRSDDPDDYVAGFPEHPHRGFETVTYLIAGRMRHRDNAGHSGVIEAGGVQWMTAGRGILHSEMPEQEDGLLFGFQLWVNLPASHKMVAPRYQELKAQAIPEERRDGVNVRVIAGTTAGGTSGPVRELATPVCLFDAHLAPGARYRERLPADHNALLHVYEGAVTVAGERIEAGAIAVLGAGSEVAVENGDAPSRLLLLSGRPLNEEVVRYGPFVMNSREEIAQAFADYRDGRLGGPTQ